MKREKNGGASVVSRKLFPQASDIMVMSEKNITALFIVAAAACGCFNIDLLSEMIPMEGEEEEGVFGDDGEGGATGGDNAPPAQDPNDTDPPVVMGLACTAGERVAEQICVAEGPVSATLRFATDEPAVIGVGEIPDGVRAEVLSGMWSSEHHVIFAGLPAEAVQVGFTLADVNGNEDSRAVELQTRPGPAMALTEVYADPWGPEPAQEFVEIVNIGEEIVDLSGWMIDDNGDYNGDLIGPGTTIAPGQVALLVSRNFDPACPDDPLPAPGTQIIYMGASIGTNGLKNSEVETVELWDAQGVLISSYGGEAGNPIEGVSAFRIRAEIPEGNPWAWDRSAVGGATPGTVPLVD